MTMSRAIKRDIPKLLWSIPVGIYALFSLYPLIWVVFQSFKTDVEFFTSQWALPSKLIWQNYVTAWNVAKLGVFYKNSAVACITSVGMALAFSTLAGYAFARMSFRGKNVLFLMFVASLMVPAPVLLVPVFLIVNRLGLLDSYAGLIGPYVTAGLPLGVLVMRNAFASLPTELVDAAKIDGCGEIGVLWRVLLPLVWPAAVSAGLFHFMTVWNEFLWALISVSDEDMLTIPVGLARMFGKRFIVGWGPMFAGLVLSASVVVILFIFLQRYFVRAITEGAIKA